MVGLLVLVDDPGLLTLLGDLDLDLRDLETLFQSLESFLGTFGYCSLTPNRDVSLLFLSTLWSQE